MRISDWSSDVCSSDLLVDDARGPWWMMTSGDEMAIKALEAVLGRKGWEDDAGKLMVGVAQRQRRGHWDTTPANAWGAVTVRRFAEMYPASAITGVTNIGLAGATASQSWPLPAEPVRSEEHTSELQSLMRISYAVFCLKKKKT